MYGPELNSIFRGENEPLCNYVEGLAKIFWPNTNGYIVGTYRKGMLRRN